MPFLVDAAATLSVGPTSQAVELSTTGTPTDVQVTNTGTIGAYIALGSSSVDADATSLLLSPGQTLVLPLGTNTYLAAVSSEGFGTSISFTTLTIS